MPIPFYLEGNTPFPQDPQRVIEMKILGAVTDAGSGTVTTYNLGGNYYGSGHPEGVVTASRGAVYIDTDAPGTLYFKRSGDATNTGWV